MYVAYVNWIMKDGVYVHVHVYFHVKCVHERKKHVEQHSEKNTESCLRRASRVRMSTCTSYCECTCTCTDHNDLYTQHLCANKVAAYTVHVHCTGVIQHMISTCTCIYIHVDTWYYTRG